MVGMRRVTLEKSSSYILCCPSATFLRYTAKHTGRRSTSLPSSVDTPVEWNCGRIRRTDRAVIGAQRIKKPRIDLNKALNDWKEQLQKVSKHP